MNHDNFFFASCPTGCEELLLAELKLFNINTKIGRGGVSFKAENKKAIEFALNTRIASRIHKEITFFKIVDEKDIYKLALKLNWQEYLKPQNTFKISTLLDRDAKAYFKSSIFLSQLLKDALVDNQREFFNQRSSVDTTRPDVIFLQRIEASDKGFIVRIYSDLTGVSLDKRGYREHAHRAPLRENLAAALIRSTTWNPRNGIFFDPMAGSGTILIEAIMIKAGLSPSFINIRNREKFSFTKQDWFLNSELSAWYKDYIEELIESSMAAINTLEPGFFFANDIDPMNIKIMSNHLRKIFGRADMVTFMSSDFLKMDNPLPKHATIVFNPPYGERLEPSEELHTFYHEIGEVLKNKYQESTAYIFTLHGDLRKNIRLKATKKLPFFNGDLDCRLLEYKLT